MLTEATEVTEKSLAARREARVTSDQKTMLQDAMALSARSLSEFVAASAQEAAAKIIQEHETIRLSRNEQITFVSSLLNARPAGAACRTA